MARSPTMNRPNRSNFHCLPASRRTIPDRAAITAWLGHGPAELDDEEYVEEDGAAGYGIADEPEFDGGDDAEYDWGDELEYACGGVGE